MVAATPWFCTADRRAGVACTRPRHLCCFATVVSCTWCICPLIHVTHALIFFRVYYSVLPQVVIPMYYAVVEMADGGVGADPAPLAAYLRPPSAGARAAAAQRRPASSRVKPPAVSLSPAAAQVYSVDQSTPRQGAALEAGSPPASPRGDAVASAAPSGRPGGAAEAEGAYGALPSRDVRSSGGSGRFGGAVSWLRRALQQRWTRTVTPLPGSPAEPQPPGQGQGQWQGVELGAVNPLHLASGGPLPAAAAAGPAPLAPVVVVLMPDGWEIVMGLREVPLIACAAEAQSAPVGAAADAARPPDGPPASDVLPRMAA